MYVGNYTPDSIEYMFMGRPGMIKAGQVVEMEDAQGRHVLNKFGKRGLLKLEFGDNPEVLKVKAREIYEQFWIRAITTFNQDNETRENQHRGYVHPTPALRLKAQELGVELVGPWTFRETANTDSKVLAATLQENASLKVMMEQMSQRLAGLEKVLSGKVTIPEMKDPVLKLDDALIPVTAKPKESVVEVPAIKTDKVPEIDITEEPVEAPSAGEDFQVVKGKLARMGRKQFASWVMENAGAFENGDYPAPFVQDCIKKWGNLYKDPWPLALV